MSALDMPATRGSGWIGRLARAPATLPLIGLIAMLAAIGIGRPAAISYFGLSLILAYALPLMFVAMAQLCIMAIGDIDLGIGQFTSLVMCLSAAFLTASPALGIIAILLAIAAYAGLGALIHLRNMPSIVATLGAAFVWYGVALTLFPTPGGGAPPWLIAFARWKPPFVPLPILVAVLLALAAHILLMRSSYGVVLRGFGGNPVAVARAGWRPLAVRVSAYSLAGSLAAVGGLLLSGLSTTGDANVGGTYTLQSIAAVIIGGGQFSGGIVSPIGAVAGAMIILLTGSMLSFADISPNWQLSVQGAILIVVLSLRRLTKRSP